MGELFLKLFNMSISASWLIAAIMLVRPIFAKAPKSLRLILWGLVGVRLVCPFSFESFLSLIPSAETVSPDMMISAAPAIHSGVSALNSAVNPIISEGLVPTAAAEYTPVQIIIFVATVLWLAGVFVMALYSVVSFIRLKLKLREAVSLRENVFLCDRIASPFILGVISPKIYLPSDISAEDTEYVIAHEKSHLKAGDFLWKPLGFILLSVYWFNPLVWLAFNLFCRDLEFACDERVIKKMGIESKKPYSQALINCSVTKRKISACPLAFSEKGVKSRIKAVLNYKKPRFWIVAVAIILCVALAVCFLTNPKENSALSGIPVGETSHKSVSFEMIDSELRDGVPYIEVQWQNDTVHNICFGDKYEIYKGKKLVNPIREQYWHLLLNIIEPHKGRSEEFNLSAYDLKENTVYRLEKEFYFEENSDKKYKAYVEFYINDNKDLKGTLLTGEELIFENGMYSSIIYTDKNMPSFLIKDNVLYIDEKTYVNGQISYWYKAGDLKEFNLKNEGLDSLMSVIGWDKGYSKEALIDNNQNAFKAVNPDTNRIFYVLEQTDGDIFITYGYSDTENIRWIFKMQKTYKDGSGEDVKVGRNPYFEGTVLEIYENSILVEPFEGQDIRLTADKITVGKDVVSTNPVPDLKVGSEIRVVYNGYILTTYPAIVDTVFAIYDLEEVSR